MMGRGIFPSSSGFPLYLMQGGWSINLKDGSKMTVQLMTLQGYIEEAQTIYLEDIREGNPQVFT